MSRKTPAARPAGWDDERFIRGRHSADSTASIWQSVRKNGHAKPGAYGVPLRRRSMAAQPPDPLHPNPNFAKKGRFL